MDPYEAPRGAFGGGSYGGSNSYDTNKGYGGATGYTAARALSFEIQNVGRMLSSTKRRITWKFAFEGETEEHMVALIHSVLTGKKKIFIDGQETFNQEQAALGEWHHPFQLDSHLLAVSIGTNPASEEYYELKIDGVPFRTLPRTTMLDLRAAARRTSQRNKDNVHMGSVSDFVNDSSRKPERSSVSNRRTSLRNSTTAMQLKRPTESNAAHNGNQNMSANVEWLSDEAPTANGTKDVQAKESTDFDPFGAQEESSQMAPSDVETFDPFGGSSEPDQIKHTRESSFQRGHSYNKSSDDDLANVFGDDCPQAHTQPTQTSHNAFDPFGSDGDDERHLSQDLYGLNFNEDAPRIGANSSQMRFAEQKSSGVANESNLVNLDNLNQRTGSKGPATRGPPKASLAEMAASARAHGVNPKQVMSSPQQPYSAPYNTYGQTGQSYPPMEHSNIPYNNVPYSVPANTAYDQANQQRFGTPQQPQARTTQVNQASADFDPFADF